MTLHSELVLVSAEYTFLFRWGIAFCASFYFSFPYNLQNASKIEWRWRAKRIWWKLLYIVEGVLLIVLKPAFSDEWMVRIRSVFNKPKRREFGMLSVWRGPRFSIWIFPISWCRGPYQKIVAKSHMCLRLITLQGLSSNDHSLCLPTLLLAARRLYFPQNGAPLHYSNIDRQHFNKKFPNNSIERG